MRSFLVLTTTSAALITSGCSGSTDDEKGSYDITIQDRTGAEYAHKGSDPSCKINTSFPESDPRRGKFFVGELSNNEESQMSLYVHFLDYTSPPPAGTYLNSDEKVDISFSTTFVNKDVDVTDAQRDLSNASVIVTDAGNGIRIELGPGFPGASGFIQCAP